VLNKILIILIILLSVGCASPTASISKSYSLDTESDKGLLIGSVKYIGLLSGYKVYFRGIDNEQSGYFEAGKGIMLIPIPPSSDFDNIKGKLQVTELPAGEYEITRWAVTSGYASLSQTQPFSVRFKVEAGKATYIGSFLFSVTDTFGLTVTGVRVDFENRYSEDIAVLNRKFPNLNETKVFMGLPKKLVKKDVGGASNTRWDMPPVFIPAGG
jgi:hypothetical protein